MSRREQRLLSPIKYPTAWPCADLKLYTYTLKLLLCSPPLPWLKALRRSRLATSCKGLLPLPLFPSPTISYTTFGPGAAPLPRLTALRLRLSVVQILSCSETIDDSEPNELDGVDSVEYEGTTPTTLNDRLARGTTDTSPAGEGRCPEWKKDANSHGDRGYHWDRKWNADDTLEYAMSESL